MSGLPDIRHLKTLPARLAPGLLLPPAKSRGDGAPSGATIGPRLAAQARFAKSALATRRSIAAFLSPAP